MTRLTIACFASLLAASPLLAETRVVTTTPSATEVVNWTAGVSYTYDGSGNVRQIGNDRFVYDQAGRLVQAQVNGVTRVYTYDAFGNRTGCTSQPGTPFATDCQLGLSIDSSSNRVKDVPYDNAGNVKSYYGHTYTYDGVNMPVRDDRGGQAKEYVYTADDERIAVHDVGSGWNWSIRDVTGKVLREFSSTEQGEFAWARDYVYRDGLLMASLQHSATSLLTYHYHLDHLGTPRRVTDQNNRTAGFHDYHAFGPEVSGGLTEAAPAPVQYTGHERDKWGGSEGPDTLDYMHARYYSPVLGRFLSIDPIISAKPQLPQTWNKYAYARGNPMTRFDPDGKSDFSMYYDPKDNGNIIRIRVNVYYDRNSVDLELARGNLTVRQKTERSLSDARAFFTKAGILLEFHRVEVSAVTHMGIEGIAIITDDGPVRFQEYAKTTRGLDVFVSTDFGVTGRTSGVGGPTLVGNQVGDETVTDEIAHALGNTRSLLPPPNVWTDIWTDQNEAAAEDGEPLNELYMIMLRGTARELCAVRIPGCR